MEIVEEAKYDRPETVSADDEALPSVEVPEVRVEMLAFVVVRLVKNAVTPFKRVAKKLEEVALVLNKLVLVALMLFKLVRVAEAEVRSSIVPLVIVVVASTDVPVAVRLPVANDVEVALPNTEFPEVIDVKIGLGETEIVEVDESVILVPAIK